MDTAQWHFLLSNEGQRLLAETADPPLTDQNHLQKASRLRGQIDPHLAQGVMDTVWLRQRAAAKFTRADQMYFTRPALEQATAEIVGDYRAKRFADIDARIVADLGCGIGGDALSLAAYATVIGVDQKWMRLAMARENLRVYGYGERFMPVQADLMDLPPLAADAFFFDPARRDQHGRRLHSVTAYRPPLNLIDLWCAKIPGGAAKISPAAAYSELPSETEIEFISVNGEVREGLLWYGSLRRGVARQATLLPEGHTLASTESVAEDVPAREPGPYLYEPDGAVIRAHLIQELARQLDAAPLDPSIAYLTADRLVPTPFARCFVVEDWFPFQLKRLRHYLRDHQVGRVTIKKRGSPLEPAALERALRLKGAEERIIFLTHVLGEPAVLIGQAC